MTAPRLMVVADLDYAGTVSRLTGVVDALVPVAADPRLAIQLRAKALDGEHLESLARAVRGRLPEAFLVLNGNMELARRRGYQGVHWPEASIPARVPAEPPWHSAAVHSLDALARAERAGVHAVVFGSVFAPGSKDGEAAGLDVLREVCGVSRVPVIAIGGITPGRVAACLEAGAHGVAVVSGVIGAPDPATAVGEYLEALDHALEAGAREATREEVQR